MPPGPPVAIVVLDWNDHAATVRCVESLRRLEYAAARIMVVDNGSDPPLAAAMLGEGVEVLRLAENRGYAGGNNAAMRAAFAAGAEFAWLFNNDATCPPDTLSRLVAACLAEPRAGLAGPLVFDAEAPEQVQVGCGMFDPNGPTWRQCFDLETAQAWQATFPERITLSGAALLVRRAVAEQIGYLDEAMFAYWEDTDYSVRSLGAGFCNLLVADARVWHAAKPVREAPNRIAAHYFYYMVRNEFLFWHRHAQGLRRARLLRWAFARALRWMPRLDPPRRRAVAAGLWDGAWRRGGAFAAGRRAPWPVAWLLDRLAPAGEGE